ncbi:hypothetical protein GOP47_0028221 [Adiantum capillus-veneris]|nr:hypothetical protein GOP47_0028221 [Adiantum capillus-veneris]
MFWRVAGASQYLAITGWSIDDIKLAKKAWILPGQTCSIIDLTPVNYDFDVQAMSAEKLPFVLPAVFTIGPKADNLDALIKYARLIAPHEKHSNHVKDLVKGIIEGETRVLAAAMTMEDIFKGTKQFKIAVFEKVQLELNEFGLLIYNANVKQLVDVPGHEYFSFLGQKTQQDAATSAKIAIADAKYRGDVGTKERQGLTQQNAARVDTETKVISLQQAQITKQKELLAQAETKIFENTKKAEMAQADAELAKKSALWSQEVELANIQSKNVAAIREAELKRQLEILNAQAELERLRAKEVVPATIQYEISVQAAQAALVQRQRAADAKLFEQQREADAITYQSERGADAQRQTADAEAYATIKRADATLYEMQKEAQGIVAMAEAKSVMLGKLMKELKGDYKSVHDFLLLDRGVYQEMGRINAEAIKGLNPKISIWDTTSSSSSSSSAAAGGSSALEQMCNIYKSIPPLLTTVQDQTGVTPLPLLASLPCNHDSSTN